MEHQETSGPWIKELCIVDENVRIPIDGIDHIPLLVVHGIVHGKVGIVRDFKEFEGYGSDHTAFRFGFIVNKLTIFYSER